MPGLPVLAVVGPTAVGKSDLAVALARRIGAEVVNADSMQLYRGMDIGTAKLPVAARQGVPHHLLDVWPVTETASVQRYHRLAGQVLADLQRREVPAVVVGGSGLYVHAALDLVDFPGTDPDVRARWEGELARHGPAALHARLRQVDPGAASAILPSNGRRLVRALEVVELTGRPFVAHLPAPRYAHPTLTVGLRMPRDVLDARIAARVDTMWAAGFVEEVRALREVGLAQGRTASRALGYAQVLAFLSGALTEGAARAETVRATRRFARRQLAWFGRDQRVRWLDADRSDLVEQVIAVLHAAD
jgi:tRNA dimethylallyltransferase